MTRDTFFALIKQSVMRAEQGKTELLLIEVEKLPDRKGEFCNRNYGTVSPTDFLKPIKLLLNEIGFSLITKNDSRPESVKAFESWFDAHPDRYNEFHFATMTELRLQGLLCELREIYGLARLHGYAAQVLDIVRSNLQYEILRRDRTNLNNDLPQE